MNSSKQIKLGALASYFSIAVNIVSGLIYTPWMITQIGNENYGLYTLTTSLITLFAVDFGMSAAVSRFVSVYRARGEQKRINDFLGLIYKLYFSLDAVIFALLIAVYFFIDVIYANLTAEEISVFKTLYIIAASFTVISFPLTNLTGVLNAYERFIELKLCDVFNKVFIVLAVVVALLFGMGVYALVAVNALAGLFTIALKLIVIKRKTEVKVNLKYFEKGLLKEIFGFSVWSTVGNLAQRLIFNITPTIIAAVSVTGSAGVAVFGVASTIEGYVYSFATAINGMFMPKISRIIESGKKDEDLLPLMIKVGRIQIVIVGLLVVGFISLGQSFLVDIWNKGDLIDAYLCAVFLIIPSFFYLPQQIANTTLIVENKVKLQAYVFIAMGLINVVLSLVLSKFFGALGASISIFAAYMFRTVAMDIIYYKKMQINIPRFFKESFLKMAPGIAISLIVGLLLEKFMPISGTLGFIINGVLLVAVYGASMWFICFNSYEKNLFLGTGKRIINKFLQLVK